MREGELCPVCAKKGKVSYLAHHTPAYVICPSCESVFLKDIE